MRKLCSAQWNFRKVLLLLSLILINSYLGLNGASSANNFAPNFMPKISIVTSVYNSDQFIEGFLANITQQTIFDQCELILINANSPGKHEEAMILKYLKKYSNITYQRLAQDPGIYGVWNLGIKQARGQYITNANVDDRLLNNCYELHAQVLDNNPEIALVYSDFYTTIRPNAKIGRVSRYGITTKPEFIPALIKHWCLPSFNPLWRKSAHEICGYFDEDFKIAGDYEMWIRMVSMGLKFKKCPGVLGIYYLNPDGLSTPNGKHTVQLDLERSWISERHKAFLEQKD
ncbi:MAG TPA: glycosyltransferase [Candidatus Babeliales bacterium]|nr:glycosyltransferase [Candidatus Babeliales bacterium]